MKKNFSKNAIVNMVREEWKYLGDRRKQFLIYLSLYLIGGTISLMTPLVIGEIFNSVQQEISSPSELKNLIFLISLLFFITLSFWIFHGIGRIIEQRTGFFVNRNYYNQKIKTVLELPVSWHKDHHSGDTIDKIGRGSSAISTFSQFFTFQITYAILNITVSTIILFFVDWRAAVIALIFSSFVFLVIANVDKRLNKIYLELNKLGNKAAATTFDYVSNIITVITLRLKRIVSEEIDNRLMASYEPTKKSIKLNEFKWAFASISISLMTVIVLIMRAYSDYITTGVIMVGTLYVLYGYLSRVGDTFYNFASIYGQIVRNNANIVSAYEIDDAFSKIKGDFESKFPKDWEKIEIKNLNFDYDKGDEHKHLEGVDFEFNRNQKIAVIGESGSGKSTFLALLRGLYYPNKGEVFIEGKKDKKGFNKLKRGITLIPQDPEIFNNTIRYNMTLGLKVSKKVLDNAIELSRFEPVLKKLPEGLETGVMEKGVSLSGGEKQRLALARGLIAAKRSSILLLDEPTSSVDSVNEIRIYNNIFKEFEGKTIISTIHRLHLLNKFDMIYMFEKGRVVAKGSFPELKENPKFKKIWDKYLESQKE